MFIGSSLLAPNLDSDSTDLRESYFEARASYSTVLVLIWVWAIFTAPIMRGEFAPTMPMFVLFGTTAAIERVTEDSRVHAITTILSWALLVVFVWLYAMQLGGALSET